MISSPAIKPIGNLSEPAIRPLGKADFPRIVSIENQVYPYPWSQYIHLDCLEKNYPSLALDIDGQLMGFAIFQIIADECHLLNIAVDKCVQGIGLGRRLLKEVYKIGKSSGAESMLLEVRVNNHSARKLYDREGFEQIGLRKNYYPAGEERVDALVLRRSLAEVETTD